MRYFKYALFLLSLVFMIACQPSKSPEEIFGNPAYRAISFGGYRHTDRSVAPTVAELKEDLRILQALDIKLLRTYHARLYDHAANLVQAIDELKKEDPSFEMYVMYGAWMQCEGAFGPHPNHAIPDSAENEAELQKSIEMAQRYPDIIKAIAVGNEAMVHWAATYYVEPGVILAGVRRLQALKKQGELPGDLWITSSDNFASWGGGDDSYHKADLEALIREVDFLSVHSYPFHDTHYNPKFWWVPAQEEDLGAEAQIQKAMERCLARVQQQVSSVEGYMQSLGVDKPIHIGETGWASEDSDLYGAEGSFAADEYKQAIYHQMMRKWTDSVGYSCFFFEAFDEPWKDDQDPQGSENHFGLISVDGVVKQVLWDEFDSGALAGLSRGGQQLRKSTGSPEPLRPPLASAQPVLEIGFESATQAPGDLVQGSSYTVIPGSSQDLIEPNAFPSSVLKLEAWEGTCAMSYNPDSAVLKVTTGLGEWWGGALMLPASENLKAFQQGTLFLELRGSTQSRFSLGLQSGSYEKGNQESLFFEVGPGTPYQLSEEWQDFTIPLAELSGSLNFEDVRALLFIKGVDQFDGKSLQVRRVLLFQEK